MTLGVTKNHFTLRMFVENSVVRSTCIHPSHRPTMLSHVRHTCNCKALCVGVFPVYVSAHTHTHARGIGPIPALFQCIGTCNGCLYQPPILKAKKTIMFRQRQRAAAWLLLSSTGNSMMLTQTTRPLQNATAAKLKCQKWWGE